MDNMDNMPKDFKVERVNSGRSWDISNGEETYTAYDPADARYLCNLLNANRDD